jgi:TM2 domain-containing membrane protein YozV
LNRGSKRNKFAAQTEGPDMTGNQDSHSLWMGYLLWIFGFTGAHRFYYGRPISGTIYFFTFGLLGIGWLLDLLLMPSLAQSARKRYYDGPYRYDVSWILLTFLGVLGVHRMYLRKWLSALVYLLTGGLFGLGVLYDYWTFSEQVSLANKR